MKRPVWTIAPLLFASGASGLVYQIAWQREIRLVFGGSTAASAVVVAIFVGGLGLGGYVLGGRADRSPSPLRFYALLEAGIAALGLLSTAMLVLVRVVYVALGGSVRMGSFLGTGLRLVLTALVLLAPTFLMGGTLAAAARAAQDDDDPRRRSVALLYAANTLGAVTGAGLATFVLLERLGTRWTLAAGCALGALAAAVAFALGGGAPRVAAAEARGAPASTGATRVAVLPLVAALLVGFVYFEMELVWYRVLGPLLGGSVFTFGLILVVALFGIGLGGLLYGAVGRRRPATQGGFAATCLLEAAALALPYALGDRVALLALAARPEDAASFPRLVLGWLAVTALVVLPASIVAGAQFPLLIALLGRGARDVGRQIGLATAFNTAGAMAGALVAGFGLFPLLGAERAWRMAVAILVALAAVTAWHGWRRAPLGSTVAAKVGGVVVRVLGAACALAVVGLLGATGPTAAWRHSPIGAGRVDRGVRASANTFTAWVRERRRHIVWSAEGIESSVALDGENGIAFLVSGKADGNSIGDAPTQVMGGLVGALLHPSPRRAMVVGLGTGSTAGWLGQVPGIERVDVAELEPAMLHVGRICAPVNRDVLSNPKVHVTLGDARETLLVTDRRYDIVFSEPSNPYRAGVSSLFTREYYEAIARRLEPGGLFLQWVQGYEVDDATLRTIFATVLAAFPSVETWRLATSDLLLVASAAPVDLDVPTLRRRITEPPLATALQAAWRAADLETVLAHYVGQPALAPALASGAVVNTDDRNVVEFGFARSVGSRTVGIDLVEKEARERHLDRPIVTGGAVDWELVKDARLTQVTAEGTAPKSESCPDEARRHRAKAQEQHVAGLPAGALEEWRAQSKEPTGPVEIAVVAEGAADVVDPEAPRWIERLRAFRPTEADAVTARLRLREGKLDEACAALESAFVRWRDDPWASPDVMFHALMLVDDLASKDSSLVPRLYRAVAEPFSMRSLDDTRLRVLLGLASRLGVPACVDALSRYEPHFPWDADLLANRRDCYALAGAPLLATAERELAAFDRCRSGFHLGCW